MKPVSPAMIDLIQNHSEFAVAEGFKVQFNNGSLDHFTDLDIPINDGLYLYKANSLRFEGLKFKIATGWSVDEQELKISAYPGERLGGSEFFAAVQEGLLDGAYITRKRFFWEVNSPSIYQIYVLTPPIQIIDLFIGRVSTINKIGRTHVELKLKSPLSLLDIDMPRNTYSPGCLWTLFDQGCTLSKAAFTFSGNVAGLIGEEAITVTGGIPSPTGADGLPTYAFGRLLFTSGVNTNLQVTINSNDASIVDFLYPPIKNIQVGDTFQMWPGCSKTQNTCTTKFNNFSHFRGFPRVPPIVVTA
jgi:uncharacterized phage protein (TIGR02218 family)